MKRLIFSLLTVLAGVFVLAAGDKGQAEITFKVKSHDFGYIQEEKGPVSYEFEFTNTGSTPLIVISARAMCGCTRPEYPRKPIAPGEKAKIKVTYVPKGRPGAFDRAVTVKTNAKTVHLRIKGSVIPAKRN